MSALQRQHEIQTAIYSLKKISAILQYGRLITHSLRNDENFESVYAIQMKRLIENEDYEECDQLKKYFKK